MGKIRIKGKGLKRNLGKKAKKRQVVLMIEWLKEIETFQQEKKLEKFE